MAQYLRFTLRDGSHELYDVGNHDPASELGLFEHGGRAEYTATWIRVGEDRLIRASEIVGVTVDHGADPDILVA